MSEKNNISKNDTSGKLGVLGLAAIVVSSMIGGGIFSLPQNMASDASVGAVLIAWLITGFGMFFIANTFRILANAKPDLTSGIYLYAKEGFGDYVGFSIGWGYWLCQIFGNVGYAIITMDALNYFFPGVFTGGNNLASIIGGSLLIWCFYFIVLKGIKQAAFINVIGTIGKMVPLAIFILIMIFVFHLDRFEFDFWGDKIINGKTLGSFGSQLKSTMLVTLWAFIGIEGAVVLSGKAKSQEIVGRATFLGFVGCLIVYVLLSVIPYGFLSQAELAEIANPSTAGVLEKVIGKSGAWIMNVGLLIAVLSSWLSWTLIVAEIPLAMSQNQNFPKAFQKENQAGSPSVSLLITSILMQLAMIFVYFSTNAWNTMLSITGVMVLPAYFASSAYLWKICEDDEYPKTMLIKRSSALITGILGCIYGIWLIYAAGLQYLLMAIVFFTLGIPVFCWSRKEFNIGQLKKYEKIIMIIMVLVSIFAIYAFARGIIKL